MAISHELSGEIAVALLGERRRTRLEINEVRDTLLKVYLILQQMSAKDRESQPEPKQGVAFKAGAE